MKIHFKVENVSLFIDKIFLYNKFDTIELNLSNVCSILDNENNKIQLDDIKARKFKIAIIKLNNTDSIVLYTV